MKRHTIEGQTYQMMNTSHLESGDPSILVPDAVLILADGRTIALHSDGDGVYPSVRAIEAAYVFDLDSVRAKAALRYAAIAASECVGASYGTVV